MTGHTRGRTTLGLYIDNKGALYYLWFVYLLEFALIDHVNLRSFFEYFMYCYNYTYYMYELTHVQYMYILSM